MSRIQVVKIQGAAASESLAEAGTRTTGRKCHFSFWQSLVLRLSADTWKVEVVPRVTAGRVFAGKREEGVINDA